MEFAAHKKGKIYYSMGEVSEMFDVNPSLIRFWESKFDILKPHKNKKGNRMFTPQDVDNLKLIYHLVKEKGMTLVGAQKRIRENRDGVTRDLEVIDRLQAIKAVLMEIRQELWTDPGEIFRDDPEAGGEADPQAVTEQTDGDRSGSKWAVAATSGSGVRSDIFEAFEGLDSTDDIAASEAGMAYGVTADRGDATVAAEGKWAKEELVEFDMQIHNLASPDNISLAEADQLIEQSDMLEPGVENMSGERIGTHNGELEITEEEMAALDAAEEFLSDDHCQTADAGEDYADAASCFDAGQAASAERDLFGFGTAKRDDEAGDATGPLFGAANRPGQLDETAVKEEQEPKKPTVVEQTLF